MADLQESANLDRQSQALFDKVEIKKTYGVWYTNLKFESSAAT